MTSSRAASKVSPCFLRCENKPGRSGNQVGLFTAHKTAHLIRDQRTQKAGQGKLRGKSVFVDAAGAEKRGIEEIQGAEPSPEFALGVADEVESRLLELGNDSLRSVALYKLLQGYSNREIAEKLGCGERSVEYKLRRIREQWTEGS